MKSSEELISSQWHRVRCTTFQRFGDYGHPLAASLCLPTDFHSSYCATPGSVHVTSMGEKVPCAFEVPEMNNCVWFFDKNA